MKYANALQPHTLPSRTSRTQTKTWQRVCLSYCTNGQRKKTTKAQHCIRAIAGEVVKSRSVHLINFGSGGQGISMKSATALILDRYMPLKNDTNDRRRTK